MHSALWCWWQKEGKKKEEDREERSSCFFLSFFFFFASKKKENASNWHLAPHAERTTSRRRCLLPWSGGREGFRRRFWRRIRAHDGRGRVSEEGGARPAAPRRLLAAAAERQQEERKNGTERRVLFFPLCIFFFFCCLFSHGHTLCFLFLIKTTHTKQIKDVIAPAQALASPKKRERCNAIDVGGIDVASAAAAATTVTTVTVTSTVTATIPTSTTSTPRPAKRFAVAADDDESPPSPIAPGTASVDRRASSSIKGTPSSARGLVPSESSFFL